MHRKNIYKKTVRKRRFEKVTSIRSKSHSGLSEQARALRLTIVSSASIYKVLASWGIAETASRKLNSSESKTALNMLQNTFTKVSQPRPRLDLSFASIFQFRLDIH